MKILAISGSLRVASLNSTLLRAVARLAPTDINVVLYRGLGDLPLSNPDIEASDPPPVADLRTQILSADALLIASPEYAHGVTGVMKNALDWMVSCEAFIHKPVALLNASPRAVHAQAALKETLIVMYASFVEDASITVPILGSNLRKMKSYFTPTSLPRSSRHLSHCVPLLLPRASKQRQPFPLEPKKMMPNPAVNGLRKVP